MEEDKFKKQTNCGYCGKEMDAKYRSKKFCSDKCRVYFGREDKKTNPEKYVFLNPIRPAREASFEDKQLAKEFLATDGGRNIEAKEEMELAKQKLKTMVENPMGSNGTASGEYIDIKKATFEEPERLPGESSLYYKIRISELQSQSKTK